MGFLWRSLPGLSCDYNAFVVNAFWFCRCSDMCFCVYKHSYPLTPYRPPFARDYSIDGVNIAKPNQDCLIKAFLFCSACKLVQCCWKIKSPKNCGIRSFLTMKHTWWMSSSTSFPTVCQCVATESGRGRLRTGTVDGLWPFGLGLLCWHQRQSFQSWPQSFSS